MTYDAIVVGSGPNGLSAAIVLAQAGLSVLVREAQPTIGGGTRSLELTFSGFIHDLCSAIHPMAIASPFFRSLPLQAHGLEWISPRCRLSHPFDNEPPAVLHRSIDQTASTLGRDCDAYKRLIDPLVRSWEKIVPEILAPTVHLPSAPFAMARFGLNALRPAASLARATFKGHRAQGLFAGMAAHSIAPFEKPGTSAIGLVMAVSGTCRRLAISKGWIPKNRRRPRIVFSFSRGSHRDRCAGRFDRLSSSHPRRSLRHHASAIGQDCRQTPSRRLQKAHGRVRLWPRSLQD